MYYSSSPYVVVLAGLLIAVTCGLSFQAVLQDAVREWAAVRTGNLPGILERFNLRFPYLGIMLGVGLFLGGGVSIFGVPPTFSYGLSLVLSLGTAGLVWWQLEKILAALQDGGSAALDLDSLF